MAVEPGAQAEVQLEPRGVEVKATPTPQMGGAPAADLHSAFTRNLTIVSGGEVEAADGRVIQTDGVLGDEKNRIDGRLAEISAAGLSLAERKAEFGRGLRGARAVRQLEGEKRKIDAVGSRRVGDADRSIRDQKRKIDQLLKDHRVTDNTRAIWDNVIAVDQFLDGNPDTTDLSPIQINLGLLGWTRPGLTRERIEDRTDTVRAVAQGFVDYRILRLGKGRGDERVKGLVNYEVERDQARAQHQQEVEEAEGKLVAARGEAERWAQENAAFKDQDTPEQRRIKESRREITGVEDYLRTNYVPDIDQLGQVRGELESVSARLERAIQLREEAAEIFGEGGIRGKGRDIGLSTQPLEKRRQELIAQLDMLEDPVKRLTQQVAPAELRNMVARVNTQDFDINSVSQAERPLASAVMVLLGKGAVRVGEIGAEEEPGAEEVPQGGAGVAAGPTNDEIDPATASLEELTPLARNLTAEQLALIPAANLARLAIEGRLTLYQLADSWQDNAATPLNNQLINEFYSTMQAVLENSVKEGGLNPDTAIPVLILDAMQRAAAWSSLSINVYTPLSLDRFRSELDDVLRNQAEKDPMLEDAKRLLEVASEASKLLRS